MRQLRPLFCLIVEDDPVLGLDLADALDAEAVFVSGPFTCGKAAFAWMEHFTPDVAYVSPALQDGMSAMLIAELHQRGVLGVTEINSPVLRRSLQAPEKVLLAA